MKDKNDKILLLDRETKMKNELIQNINAGINQKVSDLNAKIEYLEKTKKKSILGRKKLRKKVDKR